MLRAIEGLLFDLDLCVIRGAYSEPGVCYYKEEKDPVRLYYRIEGRKFVSQEILLAKPSRDETGHLIKDKNSKCLCSQLHTFLRRPRMPQYSRAMRSRSADKLGVKNRQLYIATIHGSFDVKPDQADCLKKYYRDSLLFAR